MTKMPLILGIVFLILAAVILVFARGSRRVYSGMFFTVIGVASVANAMGES